MPTAQLYEISALVRYHVVILATSKEEALAEVETWENAWHDSSDFVDVTDVDLFHVSDPKASPDHWDDEAHIRTASARAAQGVTDEDSGD